MALYAKFLTNGMQAHPNYQAPVEPVVQESHQEESQQQAKAEPPVVAAAPPSVEPRRTRRMRPLPWILLGILTSSLTLIALNHFTRSDRSDVAVTLGLECGEHADLMVLSSWYTRLYARMWGCREVEEIAKSALQPHVELEVKSSHGLQIYGHALHCWTRDRYLVGMEYRARLSVAETNDTGSSPRLASLPPWLNMRVMPALPLWRVDAYICARMSQRDMQSLVGNPFQLEQLEHPDETSLARIRSQVALTSYEATIVSIVDPLRDEALASFGRTTVDQVDPFLPSHMYTSARSMWRSIANALRHVDVDYLNGYSIATRWGLSLRLLPSSVHS